MPRHLNIPAGKPYAFSQLGIKAATIVFSLLVCFASLNRVFAQSNAPVSVVDVLMLYTTTASDASGGTAAIRSNIDEAMLEANQVFQNSGANVRVRLAAAIEIPYTETGYVSQDIAKLQNPADLDLGRASRLRDQYGADLVCLVTETGNDYAFYGLQGPSSENAFSILRRPYLNGYNYLPVTLSFNFGCQLERPDADSLAAFSYAYGYSFYTTNGFYSTVEAFSGTRLPFFSNPNITYQGVAAGVPFGNPNPADNTTALNHTAPIVAAFRAPATTTLPPIVQFQLPANTNSIIVPLHAGTNLTLQVSATDPDGSIRRVRFYAQRADLPAPQLVGFTTNSPYNIIWSNLPEGTWTLTAQAFDNSGASTIATCGAIFQVSPSNDDFAAAAQLTGTNITVTADTFNATLEPGEQDWTGQGYGSVWYSWTAPTNGRVTLSFSSNAGAAQNYFGAYAGTTVTNLGQYGASDYYDSPFDFPVNAGSNYLIVAAGPPSAPDSFSFTLNFQSTPPNDNFGNRIALTNGVASPAINNFAATTEYQEQTILNSESYRTLWWTWTASQDGIVVFDGLGCMMQLYHGDALSNLIALSSAPYFSYFSQTSPLQVKAGDVLQIDTDTQNSGFIGQSSYGPIQLVAQFAPGQQQDNFTNRLTISGTQIMLTNLSIAAVYDPNHPGNSGSDDNPAASRTLWYSWTAPISGTVTISCPNYQYIDVLTGITVTNLTDIANGSPVSFSAVAGSNYVISATGMPGEVIFELVLSTIQITAPANGETFFAGTDLTLIAATTTNDFPLSQIEFFANGQSLGVATNPPYSVTWQNVPAGNFTLTAVGTDFTTGLTRTTPSVGVTINYPPPANDNFANRITITGNYLDETGTNLGGTLENGETNFLNNYGGSIWWSWTAPNSGIVTITATGNGPHSTAFGIYTGTSISALQPVTGGIDSVEFPVTAGVTYSIASSSPNSTTGYELVLSGLVITAPADGATFTTGQNISISAALSQIETPFFAKIQFFEDGVLIGAVNTAPFTFTMTNITGGTHMLTAQSLDVVGRARAALPVTIHVKPPNDDFAHATFLTGAFIQTNGSTFGATNQVGEPIHDGQSSGASVWYTWLAPDTGTYSVVVDPANGVTAALAVYTGNTVSNLTLVATNGHAHSATFLAHANQPYHIAVAEISSNPVAFNLYITRPPANDNFANRIAITDISVPITGNNLGASFELNELVLSSALDYFIGESVWWTWTAPKSGTLTFTPATDPNHLLLIYTGNALTNLTLLPGESDWLYDDFTPLSFAVTAGTTYAISADGKWNPDWSISFLLNFHPYADNDDFTNAFALTGSSFTTNGDSTFATPDKVDVITFGPNHSVWYSWIAPSNGQASVVITSTNISQEVFVYANLNNLVQPVSFGFSGDMNQFPTVAGAEYWFEVAGAGGPFTLSLSLTPAPANDNFASRKNLDGISISENGTSVLASIEPGEIPQLPASAPYIFGPTYYGSVWYSWIAPADGPVEINCATAYMGVFTGGSVSNLTVFPSIPPTVTGLADPNTGKPAYAFPYGSLSFMATAGTEYEIEVANATQSPFTFTLTMPRAYIVSPTTGAAYTEPANFTIHTRTIDINGAVTNVSFFSNGNLLGAVTNAPFDWIETNLPTGDYTFTVQTTDTNGQPITSPGVEVRVAPGNDNFANRYLISDLSTNIIATNSGATTELGESLPAGATGRTLWWTYTAPSNGIMSVSVGPYFLPPVLLPPFPPPLPIGVISPLDVIIIINPGNPFPPISFNNGFIAAVYTNTNLSTLALVASTPVGSGYYYIGYNFQSTVSFTVTAGQTYQISLDGLNGNSGVAQMTFSFTPPPPPPLPPANDNFTQRIVLTGNSSSVVGTTTAATREPYEPLDPTATNSHTVWYSWTAPYSGTASFSANPPYYYGGPFSANVGIYTGSQISALQTVAVGANSVTFLAQQGVTYQIDISSAEGAQGDFYTVLTGPPPPPQAVVQNSAMMPGSGFNLNLSGSTGQSFVLQASTNFVDWQTIAIDTFAGGTASGTTFNYMDADASSFPQRFYRVVPMDEYFGSTAFGYFEVSPHP